MGLPGGNYILKALARIDLIFWPQDLRQKDLVQEEPEELAQEDTAQDDEANLAREEYFREILRGYGPEARRRLRQLNTTVPKTLGLSLTRNGCNTFAMVLWKRLIPVGAVSDRS